ncbi:MAG TPA: hypothetical protein VK928_07655 [Longimicrobiales bacterium]|nr:hypothetical protein [Longimicrobiales bacterium]
MDTVLFSSRSIWTMFHGIVLGGGGLLAAGAALFAMIAMRTTPPGDAAAAQSRYLARLLVATSVLLWAAVVVGTYISFPDYRATPPDGLADLGRYPRALIRSNPETAWLHSFAMESKEHMPWIAAMLATAVAFVASRYREWLVNDDKLRRIAVSVLSLVFLIVAGISFLGVLINKVAPLE